MEFPINIFPEPVYTLIKELNAKASFPIDFIASSMLTVAGMAIGNSYRIRVRDTQKEPAILYMAIVAPKGVNKSHPVTFALKPLYNLQFEFQNDYEIAKEQYIDELDYYNRNCKKKDNNLKKPSEPVAKRIIINDATIEKVIDIHSKNKKGLILYYDELAGWLSDFERYNNNSSVMQKYLSMWNGLPIELDRMNLEQSNYVKSPHMPIIGTIQPMLLNKYFGGEKFINGFTDRFLFSFPDNLKKPTELSNEAISTTLYDRYETIIKRMYNWEYNYNNPESLEFSESAYKIYKEWYKHNAEKANKENDENKKGVYSKIDMYLPRFSLIIQALKDSNNNNLPCLIYDESVIQAIELSNYFMESYWKVYNQMFLETKHLGNKEVAKYLRSLGNSQTKIADVLKISQPAVCDLLK